MHIISILINAFWFGVGAVSVGLYAVCHIHKTDQVAADIAARLDKAKASAQIEVKDRIIDEIRRLV